MAKRLEILLVEDTPSDVRLTQEALKDTTLDYNLTVLNDGEAAIEFLTDKSKVKPDLILLDLNMPKKNGHEVLEETKDLLTHIPVVLLTVSRDDDDIERALNLKMNYYMSKPVTADKLNTLLSAFTELWHGDAAAASAKSVTEDAHVRYVMAGNPHTSPTILAKLAQEKNENVRRRVAENPQSTGEILQALANDESVEVRLAVTENPNAPQSVLEQLARDPSEDVRLGMAGNPLLPEHILRGLSADENLYVVDSANKTLSMLPADRR